MPLSESLCLVPAINCCHESYFNFEFLSRLADIKDCMLMLECTFYIVYGNISIFLLEHQVLIKKLNGNGTKTGKFIFFNFLAVASEYLTHKL